MLIYWTVIFFINYIQFYNYLDKTFYLFLTSVPLKKYLQCINLFFKVTGNIIFPTTFYCKLKIMSIDIVKFDNVMKGLVLYTLINLYIYYTLLPSKAINSVRDKILPYINCQQTDFLNLKWLVAACKGSLFTCCEYLLKKV